jgi:AcrR family transcriptional regulator
VAVPHETDPGTPVPARARRADARRNHAQIVAAARDVFVDRGPSASLDEIAKRAGVGIGTLYRRFADRHTLMRAVAVDAVTQSSDTAERVLAEAPDALAALTSYLHGVLDLRVAAVMPVLLDHVDRDDPELAAARDRGVRALQEIVDDAQAAGVLRDDVSIGDIGMLLVRMARPLPGPVSAELNLELAHRHLDLLIDGLRVRDDTEVELTGPRLSFGDLHVLGD